MWLLIIACAVILVIGILEKRRHQKNIDALPVRVRILTASEENRL